MDLKHVRVDLRTPTMLCRQVSPWSRERVYKFGKASTEDSLVAKRMLGTTLKLCDRMSWMEDAVPLTCNALVLPSDIYHPNGSNTHGRL